MDDVFFHPRACGKLLRSDRSKAVAGSVELMLAGKCAGSMRRPGRRSNTRHRKEISLRPPTGWQSWCTWTNGTSQPIASFESRWAEPIAPATANGQTIYLFNGLLDADVRTSCNLYCSGGVRRLGQHTNLGGFPASGLADKTICCSGLNGQRQPG
jgi:hypothetical protein